VPSDTASPVAAALALLKGHHERTVRIKATQARHDFFPLLESVVGDPTQVVEVEHKGHAGRALLVHPQFRDYVRQLEATVQALVGPAPDGPMFRLAGSLAVVGVEDADAPDAEAHDAVEDAIAALRARERQGGIGRFDGL
jgi:hypothetical protein